MTPRIIGHAIHLCFSDGRSRGSLRVTNSPEGFRQAIAQACGERIITPSSTAWPPTRVSYPLSSAGKSWRAAGNQGRFEIAARLLDAPEQGKTQTLGYHRLVGGSHP